MLVQDQYGDAGKKCAGVRWIPPSKRRLPPLPDLELVATKPRTQEEMAALELP